MLRAADPNGGAPFSEFESGGTVHKRGPQIATQVLALSIPGMCEPGVDPLKDFDPSTDRSIAGLFLVDLIVEQKNARAIGSAPLRAMVPFLWQGFGLKYAAIEALLYTVGYLLPFSVMCSLLAGMYSTEDVDSSMTIATVLSSTWMLRQVFQEGRQCLATRSVTGYFGDIWNIIDVLLFALYCATVSQLFVTRDLWWCKQAATATVLLTYLKLAQFLQAFPGLGRLVQLVITVVPAMQNFMVILSLAVAGLGLAFMLVFSAGPYSAKSDNKDSGSVAKDAEIDIEFSTVPITFFRSFTTISGDFDVETLWMRGSPAVVVFLIALLFGNGMHRCIMAISMISFYLFTL